VFADVGDRLGWGSKIRNAQKKIPALPCGEVDEPA